MFRRLAGSHKVLKRFTIHRSSTLSEAGRTSSLRVQPGSDPTQSPMSHIFQKIAESFHLVREMQCKV